mmetsp:Transcript_27223/g.72622  ORF Transcript_27223/g.72622 Transcript_27223/m.72622 type:complete len:366 (+) Transcript_27223:87-1184(+)
MSSAIPDSACAEVPACYEASFRAIDEEEDAWLPNPYQEQADAQVAAGAWPGMPVLFGAMKFVATPGSSPWGAQDQCYMMVPMEAAGAEQQDCGGWNVDPNVALSVSDCWAPDQSWGYYFPVEEEEGKALANGSASSTDEGEAASDSQEESEKSAAEEALENCKECDDGENGKYIRKLSHANVPKNTDMARFAEKVEKDKVTTLMVRNIPNMYTRSMLVEEMDSLGFEGEYDFIYLPIDKSTQWNVGYAFVNFKTSDAAKRCVTDVTDYTFNRFEHGSRKVAQISVAHIQGLEKNLEYYSKTAVQCARVNSHRPHFVSDRRKEGPEASGAGRSWRQQRRGRGAEGSRRGAGAHQQEPGSWHRGRRH